MKAPPRARLAGFTLIELIAVIAINLFAIKEWKFAIVVHPIFMVAGNGLIDLPYFGARQHRRSASL